jgi:precorrin-6B methylase 2
MNLPPRALRLLSGGREEKFFWGCLPFVVTPPQVVRRMLELAGVCSSDVVMDLGSGDGRVLLTAVRDFDARIAIGYELREDLIKSARERLESLNLEDRVILMKADIMDADLSETTVIFIYLTGTANDKLRFKFEEEVRPGTRIVSHDFSMDGWRPAKVESFEGHKIYLYVAPRAFGKNSSGSSKWHLKFWH